MRYVFHLAIYFLSCSFYGMAAEEKGACLHASLSFEDQTQTKPEKIVPGSLINLKAKVRNRGEQSSAPGTIYVRFVFLEPFAAHQKSLLFQTEKVSLPSIAPNQEVEIRFKTHHQWPSFFDYIREDWPMRRYEAVVAIDNQEHVIGSIGVAISAHYYQGLVDEMPKQVPTIRP